MKVAIWGSYNYGNYGDDLMAFLFAEALKKMGVTPCVYRLDKTLADRYAIATTNSLEELFQGAKFCIIGGGGMLVEKLASIDIENDFRDLYEISSRQNCPVYPISIGGDGKGVNTPLSYWRRQFWQGHACQTTTIRLKEDLALVKSLGKEAIYYPDVLWSVADYWELSPPPKSSGQLHVGINIGKSVRKRFLTFLISTMAGLKKDIVFHFIRTHLENYPIGYEIQAKKESERIKNHVYKDPKETLIFLKSLDLLISTKLHLGLTALALGVPFYSYQGSSKAESCLKEINADFAIWKSDEISLGRFISNAQEVSKAKDKFDWSIIEEMQNQSRGHVNFLEEIVKKESQA